MESFPSDSEIQDKAENFISSILSFANEKKLQINCFNGHLAKHPR